MREEYLNAKTFDMILVNSLFILISKMVFKELRFNIYYTVTVLWRKFLNEVIPVNKIINK